MLFISKKFLIKRNTPYTRICDFYSRDDVSRFASTNSFWNDPLDSKGNNDMGMCIAVDPRSYNYRWNTKYCNGPDTASFVCQIPGKKYLISSVVERYHLYIF